MAIAGCGASLPDMASTQIKMDVSALRRAGITKAKELRSALDEAVLYLAASARKRLREVASAVFDRGSPPAPSLGPSRSPCPPASGA